MIMAANTADKTSLEIKRFINAPRDRVYAAWTDPAQLKQWWGPEGVRTRNFTADARVSGRYRWDLFNQEGEEMTVFGEYRAPTGVARAVGNLASIALPTGHTTNDILLLFFCEDSNVSETCTGYTQLGTVTNGANQQRCHGGTVRSGRRHRTAFDSRETAK